MEQQLRSSAKPDSTFNFSTSMDAAQAQTSKGGVEDWGGMLDRLSRCITPEEEVEARQMAVDRGSPNHLRDLHNHVAGLLVAHGIATWQQLRASFPRHCSNATQEMEQEQGTDPAALERNWMVGTDEPGGKDAANGGHSGSTEHSEAADAGKGGHMQAPGTYGSPGVQSGGGHKRKAEDQPEEYIMRHHNLGGTLRKPVQSPDHADNLGYKKYGTRKPGDLTLGDYPRIVAWWHPSKNGDTLPQDYPHACKERVWLQCPGCQKCGEVHEWDASAKNVTQHGGEIACPACISKNRRLCSCRAISADEYLAAEWHEDNPHPSTVPVGSCTMYRWRCGDAACGHVWEGKPNHRSGVSRAATDCPACKKGRRRCLAAG